MMLVLAIFTTASAWADDVVRGGTASNPVELPSNATHISTKYQSNEGYFVVNQNTTIDQW